MPAWNPRANDIFLAALDIEEPSRRRSHIDGACGDDAELKRQVEALLEAHNRAGSFLDRPAEPIMTADFAPADALTIPPRIESANSQIGPYKLLERVGEGGMGEVWLAEQREPVRRRVALKVIKSGMDSAQIVARFEAERQALALMDHPNIARVFDGGQTETGRLYFVMELVKGKPITEYCDEQRLAPDERLRLFIQVCQAIQHAHQKGIIHRDLKPSNVLVAPFDGRPVVKVIDFGVAKAVGQQLTERTMFTGFGAMIGTLQYMSPEQAELNNQDIDTRSDIYSLGVVLYELLTGTTPLDMKRLRDAAAVAMLMAIQEEVPPKPSTRLSDSQDSLPSIAAQRHMEPAKLTKLVSGDLDWITMKALSKDRAGRYQTANGLARDIERYLANEPVEAGPPSTAYRLRKFVNRNRASVAAAVLVTLALLTAVIGTSWGMVQAQKARSEAESQRDAAVAARQRTREALDLMTSHVAESAISRQREMLPEQRQFLEQVLSYYQSFAAEPGEDRQGRERLASAHARLAPLLHRLGRTAEAADIAVRGADVLEALVRDFPTEPDYRSELASALNTAGVLLIDVDRRSEAEAAHRRGIELRRQLVAESPDKAVYQAGLAQSRTNQGRLFTVLGQTDQAAEAFGEAIAIRERLLRDSPQDEEQQTLLATSLLNWGNLLFEMERYADAEAACRRVVEIMDPLVAKTPNDATRRADLALGLNNLGGMLAKLGRLPEAEQAYSRAASYREQLTAAFPAVSQYAIDLGGTCCNLGHLVADRGNAKEALDWYSKAIRPLEAVVVRQPKLALARQFLANTQFGRGEALMALGRYVDALQAWDQVIANGGTGPGQTMVIALRRAGCLARTGQAAEAAVEIEPLIRHPSIPGFALFECAGILSLAAGDERDADKAKSHAGRAIELLRRSFATDGSFNRKALDDADFGPIRSREEFAALIWDYADGPSPKSADPQ